MIPQLNQSYSQHTRVWTHAHTHTHTHTVLSMPVGSLHLLNRHQVLVSKTWLTSKFEVSTFLGWVFVHGKDYDSAKSKSQRSSFLMSIFAQNVSVSWKWFLSEPFFFTTIVDTFLAFWTWNKTAVRFNSQAFIAPTLFYNLFKSAYYSLHSM